MIFKDGLNYRFTQRSFQEYFTAVFLKELPDENLEKMGIGLIKKDCFRAINDNAFSMLYDMAQERMEQKILLPLINEVEPNYITNLYDFYFKKLVHKIFYDYIEDYDVPQLAFSSPGDRYGNSYIDFLWKFSFKLSKNKLTINNENTFLNYLRDTMN